MTSHSQPCPDIAGTPDIAAIPGIANIEDIAGIIIKQALA